MSILESNMTEAEFEQLRETNGTISTGWNSDYMASCVVACNENGTPAAMMFSSKDTDFEIVYRRF
jgi:hypothetical protein